MEASAQSRPPCNCEPQLKHDSADCLVWLGAAAAAAGESSSRAEATGEGAGSAETCCAIDGDRRTAGESSAVTPAAVCR